MKSSTIINIKRDIFTSISENFEWNTLQTKLAVPKARYFNFLPVCKWILRYLEIWYPSLKFSIPEMDTRYFNKQCYQFLSIS